MKKTFKHSNNDKASRRISPVLIAAIIVFVFCISSMIAAFLVDARHVKFYFTGSQTATVEYGETYKDPGVYAVTSGRLFGESTKHLDIEKSISGNADSLGTYEIVYTARWLFREYSASRTITVVDTTPPVITLVKDPDYVPSWFSGYEEEGFTATDNADGDITGKVKRTEFEDRIEYSVSDSSGNETTVIRTLDFLGYIPEIKLNGGDSLTVTAGLEFTDPGYAAVDMHGNDISNQVEVSGEVIPYLAGEYQLNYEIYNKEGDVVSSAVRLVTVVPAPRPETVRPDEKVIYLTFDDGPGPYTAALLDKLKELNIKVTFFVTNCYPKYQDMIGRAAREGHAIAVHTYCHNYNKIYASEEAYFDDFFAMQEVIKEQTGSYTKLFRFPGGSSNTVSRFNEGIMTRLSTAMTDMGYTYFDWNVSSGDAGETTKTDKVVSNVTDGCGGRQINIVLQHDIKDFSVNAVEKIVKWGLQNGYTFRALDETSPTAHHGIAN